VRKRLVAHAAEMCDLHSSHRLVTEKLHGRASFRSSGLRSDNRLVFRIAAKKAAATSARLRNVKTPKLPFCRGSRHTRPIDGLMGEFRLHVSHAHASRERGGAGQNPKWHGQRAFLRRHAPRPTLGRKTGTRLSQSTPSALGRPGGRRHRW